jgi:hypothetical protein
MGRAQATKASSKVGAEDTVEAVRSIARAKLHEIKQRANDALREQGIDFPVFVLIAGSDRAVFLVGTTNSNNPSDDECELAVGTVGSVVEEIIGLGKTSSSEIACLEVHPHTMGDA